jgi:hypothetical protein
MDMEKAIIDQLYAEFQLKERKGQGNQMFKYVTNEDITDRMNRTFAGNWSTEVMSSEIIDDQVLVRVRVMIKDPNSDDYFFQEGFGGQQIMRFASGQNTGKIIDVSNNYKSALSKAIVSACARWGVGLFKDYTTQPDGDQMDELIIPALPRMPAVAMGSSADLPKTPWIPAPTPASTTAPAGGIMALPPGVVIPKGELKETAPQQKDLDALIAAAISPQPVAAPKAVEMPPAPKPMVTPNITIPSNFVNQVPPVAAAVAPPNFSLPPTIPSPTAVPADLPFSGIEQTGNGKISDVQKAALNAILSIRKISYNDLALEAFANAGITRSIPPADDLSYEDAVVVIKFGNDKYRKR